MQNGSEFWSGRRVLLTGHTGFKGGWLAIWLKSLGAVVKGISFLRSPRSFRDSPCRLGMETAFLDIRNYSELATEVDAFNPEVVFHLAAQPLVRYSYSSPFGNLFNQCHWHRESA